MTVGELRGKTASLPVAAEVVVRDTDGRRLAVASVRDILITARNDKGVEVIAAAELRLVVQAAGKGG